MSVEYEWCVCVVDEFGDAGDLRFEPTFAGAKRIADQLAGELAAGERVQIELYRNEIRDGDLSDRQFALVKDGAILPAYFDGGARIPERFRRELDRAAANVEGGR